MFENFVDSLLLNILKTSVKQSSAKNGLDTASLLVENNSVTWWDFFHSVFYGL